MKKLTGLSCLLTVILLFGCQSSTASSSSEGTSGAANGQELSDEALRKMAEGYSTLGIYSSGTLAMGYSSNYIETRCKSDEYILRSWDSVTGGTPTQEKLVTDVRYQPCRIWSVMEYLSEAELGLDNQIHLYPLVTSSGDYIYWSLSGYSNCFGDLTTDSFTREDEETYSLKMNDEDLQKTNVYTALPTQFTGMMGLTLSSFRMKTDHGFPSSYEMSFEQIDTLYGTMTVFLSGEFTGIGFDVIGDLKPVEGDADSIFEEAIASLQNQNFRLDVTLPSKKLEIEVEDGGTVLYDIYNSKGKKTGSYGYYQFDGSTVQSVTRIGNAVYPDGERINGSMLSILPGFGISSVFFTKSETSDGLLYTYREDLSSGIAQSTDYGMMAGSSVGQLSILIQENQIVITNKLRIGEEKFIYRDIGKVSGLLDSLETNCDRLTWSELSSNQPEDLNTLLNTVPQEALDSIPTVGGNHAYVNLDVSYNPKKPVFVILPEDYNEGVEMFEAYASKLIAAGFEKNDNSGPNGGDLYTKSCMVDGISRKVSAEIFLAADYFKTTQFLMYPGLI